MDGDAEDVDAEATRLLAVLRRADPGVRVARTPEERAALWAGRLGFAIATTAGGKRNFVNDITVPRQRIPEMMSRVREIAARHRLDVPIVAHAGDGNVHPVILYEEHERDAVFTAASEMTDAALDLGGTITGEHGVGSDKLPHMVRRFTPAEIGSFRAIKRAFDPQGCLNPGVLLPAPSPGEPVDPEIEGLVTAALSGSPSHPAPSRSGPESGVAIDEENLTVETGAAARCEDVRDVLGARGLRNEAFEGTGTVGDAVHGPGTLHSVRPSLLAIEAELEHGRVRFGSAAIKDVAGLDAKRLLTGPSGGVGVLQRAIFRVTPKS